jgi:lysozyme
MPEEKTPRGKAGLIVTVGAATAALLLPFVGGWEGKRNDPYQDIVGVWTVCYGETRVKMEHYTDAECEDMLANGLTDFAKPVLARNPGLKDRPYQLAAAVSLSYNIGSAAYNRSTVARRFSQGRWKEGCNAILMWNKAGGKVVKGLTRRREAERKICLQGV